MALLNVNAAMGAEGTDGHIPAGTQRLDEALAALPNGHPTTILIHGYRFCPSTAAHDPHRHILSLTPRRDCWKAVSWPRHLHLDRPGTGLGIGFGWPATGALPRVARRAFDAGRSLGQMISAIHRQRPDIPVRIVAHSLGARVALTALHQAPPGVIHGMILISGAEYRGAAERALSGPGASRCAVLNVTSGENAAFDVMFRLAVAPERRSTARSPPGCHTSPVPRICASTTPRSGPSWRPWATGFARPPRASAIGRATCARVSSHFTVAGSIRGRGTSRPSCPRPLHRRLRGSAVAFFPASNPTSQLQVGPADHRSR
jgi:pimeloyl-ACP methyl ester carboxylesterase